MRFPLYVSPFIDKKKVTFGAFHKESIVKIRSN